MEENKMKSLQKAIEWLKVRKGRQLSQEQMAQALNESIRDFSISIDRKADIDEIVRLPNGDFERSQTKYRERTTPDISHGWKYPHRDFYDVFSMTSFYTIEGKLRERKFHIGIPIVEPSYSYVKVYNPAGRFVGKREKRDK
jgi:hypothetical protein